MGKTKTMQPKETKVERQKPQEDDPSPRWTREFEAQTAIDPELLGGKGASLAEMTRLGLPVPPGFTLTTDVWHSFDATGRLSEEIWQENLEQLHSLERKTGKTFGDVENPLIVSVRSGAKFSMPGMMDTVLNVGLNQETVKGLAKKIGQTAAQDAHQRLQETFATVLNHQGELPKDPTEQLRRAILGVLASWNNPRAVDYRRFTGIPGDAGTAVTIQDIVFGNIPDGQSGAGVAFTRNPHTGEKGIWGEFVNGTQGVEVVSGKGIAETLDGKPWSSLLNNYAQKLEKYYRHVLDIEFTLEKGELWLLQSRTAKLDPVAAIVASYEMFKNQLISEKEAFSRVKPEYIHAINHPVFDSEQEEMARRNFLVAKGKSVSPGAVVGHLALTTEEAENRTKQGDPVILVCSYFDPNEVKYIFMLNGIATTIGGTASHIALIIRAAAKPGIVGCEGVVIDPRNGILNYDNQSIKSGEIISLDGTTGEIFKGAIKQAEPPELSKKIMSFLELREKSLGKSPWAAALYPVESPYHRQDFIHKIKEKLAELSEWKSKKAQEAIILNTLVSQEDLIQSVVLRPDDTEGIREALRAVAQIPGRQNIPRTCHYPEKLAKAPYCIVPSAEVAIEDFLTNPDYPDEKYKGLIEWKKDPSLEGILIPAEPEGKLDKNLAHLHFAFTISFIEPSKVVIDISLRTPLLRSFEQINPNDLVQVIASIDSETPNYLGQIDFSFGTNKVDSYTRQVAQSVASRVFREWWQPPFALPHLMAALDDSLGLSALEGQGRTDDNGQLLWCLVYGAKGSEEKEKLKGLRKD